MTTKTEVTITVPVQLTSRSFNSDGERWLGLECDGGAFRLSLSLETAEALSNMKGATYELRITGTPREAEAEVDDRARRIEALWAIVRNPMAAEASQINALRELRIEEEADR